MHSCFGGKTVVFKGTVDECNEFRHIIVAISLFCIVRRIGKVLVNFIESNYTDLKLDYQKYHAMSEKDKLQSLHTILDEFFMLRIR